MRGIRMLAVAALAGMFFTIRNADAEARLSSALAMSRYHGLHFLRGVSQDTILIYLIVGLLAIGLLVVALRRRRRSWFRLR